MNIQYCQPEPNITDLARRERGARLECERLAAQIEATIKHAIALAALLALSACGTPGTEDAPSSTTLEQTDAGVSCTIELCGVAHSGLCSSKYGDVVYHVDGMGAAPGEPSWCSTSDQGDHWTTCCAVWCTPGDDATFEYQCGTVAK